MIPLHYSEGRGRVSNRPLQSGPEPPLLPPRPARPPGHRGRRQRSGFQRPAGAWRRVPRPHSAAGLPEPRPGSEKPAIGRLSSSDPDQPNCYPLHHTMHEFSPTRQHIFQNDSFGPIRKNHFVGLSEHNGEKMFKTKRVEADGSGEENVFSSTDVSRLSGVSLRQLQWWDEQKVVSPRHEGHRRMYALQEVVEVSVIAA